MDELVLSLGGLPYADFEAMAAMIASTTWNRFRSSDPLIIYSNEATGVIVDNLNCFKQPVGYTMVPASQTWISFDLYSPPASFVKELYEKHL